MKLVVQVAQTENEALGYVAQGYIPVECVYGDRSVVDELMMDHHNEHFDLEPVSLRAYRDSYGVARKDPRFVVGPKADLDATFAIAAMAGLVPHPCHSWATNRVCNARNLCSLAEMIARRDDDPLFVLPVGKSFDAKIVACWESKRQGSRFEKTYLSGIYRWWNILTKWTTNEINREVRKYQEFQAGRIEVARGCLVESIGKGVGLVSANIWGFDQWLSQYDVIISHRRERDKLVVSVKSKQQGIDLFGKSGLLELRDTILRNHLGCEWGGRASMLVSPRNQSYELNDARNLAVQIKAIL